jgi:hypothetical protein
VSVSGNGVAEAFDEYESRSPYEDNFGGLAIDASPALDEAGFFFELLAFGGGGKASSRGSGGGGSFAEDLVGRA